MMLISKTMNKIETQTKIFCCNCKHLCDEIDFMFYASIHFRNDKNYNKITHGMYLCRHNVEITKGLKYDYQNYLKQKMLL
jgi:hypothetical protein